MHGGQALARLGGGAFAIPLQPLEPLAEQLAWRGEKIQEVSWKTYGAAPASEFAPKAAETNRKLVPGKSEEFLE
jgi:hypothetical protein